MCQKHTFVEHCLNHQLSWWSTWICKLPASLTHLFFCLPLLAPQTANALPAGTVLNFSAVLPSDTTHNTFPGSLTTPPCTQGVLWHVMQTPLTISAGQVGKAPLPG